MNEATGPETSDVFNVEIVEAALVADPARSARPRCWTALLVTILAIVSGIIVSGVVLVAALFVVSNAETIRADGITELLETIFKKPWGVAVILVPGQLVFLAMTLSAAFLSPDSIQDRLDLKRGRFPKWTWVVMALATPFATLPVSLLFHFFPIKLSEQVKLLNDMLASQTGFSMVTTAVLIAVIPAVVEELLFRGYLQSRLLRVWPPAAAIGVSALIFSIAHLDPMHAMSVFPLGIWLGVIAWRSGSIYPAMLGHFVNNLLAFVSAQLGDGTDTKISAGDLPILAVMGLFMAISLYVLFCRDAGVDVDDRDAASNL